MIHFSKLNRIQENIARQVTISPVKEIKLIAGGDVAYARKSPMAVGAAFVLTFPEMEVVDKKTVIRKIVFPYITNYFAFRELPVVKDVLNELEQDFDLLFCEGHGLAHPRHCGLATHLGVLLQKPTIGVAKNRLLGKGPLPSLHRGNYTFLKDEKGIVGASLCTQNNIKPVFVSVGNLITLQQAIQFTLNTAIRYRLPEPIRQAHLLSRRILKETMDE